MKVSHLLNESADINDAKSIADKIAAEAGIKFKRNGEGWVAKFKGESKDEFGMRVIEGNKALKAEAAEGNSEYDRWNVKSGVYTVYVIVYGNRAGDGGEVHVVLEEE